MIQNRNMSNSINSNVSNDAKFPNIELDETQEITNDDLMEFLQKSHNGLLTINHFNNFKDELIRILERINKKINSSNQNIIITNKKLDEFSKKTISDIYEFNGNIKYMLENNSKNLIKINKKTTYTSNIINYILCGFNAILLLLILYKIHTTTS